ncbi:DUF1524 domain-containing protein [Demequina sp. NBRC 110053]|uniref:GmrSD restriction endonuclease domain-containing protein n=1 Tax=Demequina sp. NBRC 110053 TaxID=1570342 RepID=UPI0009FBE535|nr:DUF1524 domain-containing protein [Demequina sp. NBRC 110053]
MGGPRRPWWTTWPAIVLGFALFTLPGVVLLWLRRGAPLWLKVVATALAVPAFVGVIAPQAPHGGAAASSPAASATAEPAPTARVSPSTAPSPTATATAARPAASASALPSPDPASEEAAALYGTAYAAALRLEVKGRGPRTGYDRDVFGSGWIDVDRNGCDTRNDMLALRLTAREMSGSCTVLAGRLVDPFTGAAIWFERGGASEVDIDHLVALSDAWVKGAATWEHPKRVAFANDPLNLEPVDAAQNRAKGDGDAATWLPPRHEFRCEYVARQVAVKAKYEVWVTRAELDAILRVLDRCPEQELPPPGAQPVLARNAGPAPRQTARPAAPEEAPADAQVTELDERYPYCKDLPTGLGPYVKGEDAEYAWYSDRDGDGRVCE